MISLDVLLAYSAACLLVVLAPGPDNILAIGRGLSQGPRAAALSALGAGVVFIASGLSMLALKSRSA